MIEQIGLHKIRHGDLMDGISELTSGEMVDIFYCDPPWGTGTMKAFETLRQKTELGPRAEYELTQFLDKLFIIAMSSAKNVVFIEYGKKWKDQVIESAQRCGLIYHKTILARYKSGSHFLENHIHVFSKHGLSEDICFKDFYEEKDAVKQMEEIIRPFIKAGAILLDVCCGLGTSAQVCRKNNMVFYGNEINASRLNKTKQKLI